MSSSSPSVTVSADASEGTHALQPPKHCPLEDIAHTELGEPSLSKDLYQRTITGRVAVAVEEELEFSRFSSRKIEWVEEVCTKTDGVCDTEAIRVKDGLPKCSFHDLRKSYCTNLADAVPLHVVQELAGHADIRTTRKHYLKVPRR